MSAGWVYVLINPSMPGLVKVGQTSRDPESRATELASVTGVATPFTVAFKEFFEDAVAAERYVHMLLESKGLRVNASREFFQADATTAIKAVMAAPGQCEPFDCADGDDGEPGEDPAVVLFEEAECYRYGTDDTLANPAKALALHQQAASLGCADAWLAMGNMYLYGEVGRENEKQAIECFHKAVEAGSYFGYARLGDVLSRIDQKESDKAWRLFFQGFLDNPNLPSRSLSTQWHLASYVYNMTLSSRTTDIPAWDLFSAIREEVTEYIGSSERKAAPGSPSKTINARALEWLEAHP